MTISIQYRNYLWSLLDFFLNIEIDILRFFSLFLCLSFNFLSNVNLIVDIVIVIKLGTIVPLSETQGIEIKIMIVYGKSSRSQGNNKYLDWHITQSIVNKVKKKCRDFSDVCDKNTKHGGGISGNNQLDVTEIKGQSPHTKSRRSIDLSQCVLFTNSGKVITTAD